MSNSLIIMGNALYFYNLLGLAINYKNKYTDFFKNIQYFYGTSSGALSIPFLITEKFDELYENYIINNNPIMINHLPILDKIPIIKYIYKFIYMIFGFGYYKGINTDFLRKTINEMTVEQKSKLYNSTVVTYDYTNSKEIFFNLDGSVDDIIAKIECSCALYPILPMKKYNNTLYVDGAFSEILLVSDIKQEKNIKDSEKIYIFRSTFNQYAINGMFNPLKLLKFIFPMKLILFIFTIYNQMRFNEYINFKKKYNDKIVENICNIDNNEKIISYKTENYIFNANNIPYKEKLKIYSNAIKKDIVI